MRERAREQRRGEGRTSSRRGGGRVLQRRGARERNECGENGMEDENRGKREYQEAEAAA